MGRYVDADALIQLGLQDGAYEYVSVQEIEEFPTADVAPVVHGEWIPEPFGYGECSVCHTKTGNRFAEKFCHNCGAKMDNENGTKN